MSATPAKRQFTGSVKNLQFTGSFARGTGPFSHSIEEATPFLSVTSAGPGSSDNPGTMRKTMSESVSSESVMKNPRSAFAPKPSKGIGSSRGIGPQKISAGHTCTSSSGTKSRGPTSRETPCISQETPMVLATARQMGSSIMTSCNTESIRQLQNPYSECTSMGTTSSEYFQKGRMPVSASTPGSKSRTTSSRPSTVTFESRSRSDETEQITDGEVSPHHAGMHGSNESSDETQAYMGVLWHGGKLGVAYYDLDTTIIHVMLDAQEDDSFKFLLSVIEELRPGQVIVSSKQDERLLKVLREHLEGSDSPETGNSSLQFLPSNDFSAEICKRRVLSMDLPYIPSHYTYEERTLRISSLIPFENLCMVRAMGGLLKYLEKMRIGIELEEMGTKLPVLDVKIFTLESQMILDDTAYSALQIFQRESHPSVYKLGTNNAGKEGLSLFGIMNRTKSQIGSRMLRTWFQRPLKNAEKINSRQTAIAYLNNPQHVELVLSLEDAVKNMKNISKILARMLTSQASIGDWQALYKTVYNATCLKEICKMQSQSVDIFRKITETFSDDLHRITNFINKIVDFQECSIQGRFVVKSGVDEQLDQKKRVFSELPEVMTKVALDELNKLEDYVTECSVLYMPQIGYLLAIPESAITDPYRAEKDYEIEELKFVFASNNVLNYRSAGTRELDSLLGDTRCDITDMETAIMHKLQNIVLEHSNVLLSVLDLAAELDCLLSLASCAREYNYVRPIITEENVLEIVAGRHPIQEMCCSTFVPNDVQSNSEYGRVKIMTGPNACGKSVYLKQVALIVFLAQVGSFIPAEEARLGLVDRIFTRVRSLESVSVGLSTFMIDINQMSEALRSAVGRSLCIIDEFGKGTDMIDGLSLLCASISHWVGQGDQCPHVFVSTHFHSIIHQHLLPRSPLIKYLTLESLHNGEELVFLYQLVEGHTSSSYACHVAAKAGLPPAIIRRGIEASELIRQCKPVQRVDTVDTDTQYRRCEAIVSKFMTLDLETADVNSFLSQFVLPTIEGKL
ncbi:mutS protein homolog 5-like [Mya arenaria]|uniref:mutS protein homolog 5-like n=1 Tax=Mya arenaria TaxID=6604 RepID=UPI0022E3AABA|nr:mutS protein homolog 5-like [Mya arenaria]